MFNNLQPTCRLKWQNTSEVKVHLIELNIKMQQVERLSVGKHDKLKVSRIEQRVAVYKGTSAAAASVEPLPKIAKLSHVSSDGVMNGAPLLLKIKKLSENAITPSRASPLSAGYDLSSAVETKVPARGKALVPTDLNISIPEGTYARIAPRSGLAWKHSIDVGAGVIDADYRGPVGVVLFNYSDVDFEIKVGDRIAQMIIERIMTLDVVEVDDLDATARGEGGFGSTGV